MGTRYLGPLNSHGSTSSWGPVEEEVARPRFSAGLGAVRGPRKYVASCKPYLPRKLRVTSTKSFPWNPNKSLSGGEVSEKPAHPRRKVSRHPVFVALDEPTPGNERVGYAEYPPFEKKTPKNVYRT